jgi:hypothetical protein
VAHPATPCFNPQPRCRGGGGWRIPAAVYVVCQRGGTMQPQCPHCSPPAGPARVGRLHRGIVPAWWRPSPACRSHAPRPADGGFPLTRCQGISPFDVIAHAGYALAWGTLLVTRARWGAGAAPGAAQTRLLSRSQVPSRSLTIQKIASERAAHQRHHAGHQEQRRAPCCARRGPPWRHCASYGSGYPPCLPAGRGPRSRAQAGEVRVNSRGSAASRPRPLVAFM